MARRQRARARPAAPRKKARRRPLLVPTSPSAAGAAARPKVVPFPSRGRPAADTITPPQVRTYDYGYVLRELRRIVIIGGAALLLLVVLSFVLR